MKFADITYCKTYLHFYILKKCQIDDLLHSFYLSKKTRYAYYQNHCIKKNGNIVKQSALLNPGDVVDIFFMQTHETIPSWNVPLDICYEDDLFLIVSKPAFMIVHSDGVNTSHTLNNCVQHYYHIKGINIPVRPIHRLDQDTSGLVMYVKIMFFLPLLDHMLQEKEIERIYLAWVSGDVSGKLTMDQSIGKDRHNAKKMRIHPHGLHAYTTAVPIQNAKNCTLLKCRIKTGRTHQIRIHLAYHSHPILSDPLYGTKDARIHRLALHAWKLRFYHPLLECMQDVTCDCPDDMDVKHFLTD